MTIPHVLPKILSTSRQKNREIGITSALVYRQGRYIQLIEGEENDVNNLYQSINSDSRHEQIEKVVDITIAQRTFSDIDMQLMLNIQEDIRFVNFIAVNKDAFLRSSHDITKKLAYFGCDDLKLLSTDSQKYDEIFYIDKSFLLKEYINLDWFEIGMLDPEMAIAGIHLSKALFRHKYSYRELLASREFGTAENLIYILNTLHATGNLLIVDTPAVQVQHSKNNVRPESKTPSKRGFSFGQKVISWLRKH